MFSGAYGLLYKLKFDKFILLVVPSIAILFCVSMAMFCSLAASPSKSVIPIFYKSETLQTVNAILSKEHYFKSNNNNKVILYKSNKRITWLNGTVSVELNGETSIIIINGPRYIIDKVNNSLASKK